MQFFSKKVRISHLKTHISGSLSEFDLISNPQFTFQMTLNHANIFVLKQFETLLEELYREVEDMCHRLGYDKYLPAKKTS